jgi:two-component sensor histidine kinase/CheY-like chemotaxis protein
MLLESRSRVTSMAMIHERLSRATDLRRVDLAEYVRELARALFEAYRTGDADVSLRLDIAEVTSDVESMIPCGLILNEMVSNALKYAFPGGRAGEIAVSLGRLRDGAISLSVADNGAGMPEGFAISGSRSLGMSIMQTLADQLRGRLAIESAGGARFTLVFRDEALATEVEGAPQADVARKGEDGSIVGRLRILLAEDNSINSMMIERMLVASGHEVTVVGSGDEVLAALRAGAFDLVLLDVLMPGMDGLETVRAIRADSSGAFRRDIPVIAITGLDSADDLRRLREAGMDDCLVKPLDRATLDSALASLPSRRDMGCKR